MHQERQIERPFYLHTTQQYLFYLPVNLHTNQRLAIYHLPRNVKQIELSYQVLLSVQLTSTLHNHKYTVCILILMRIKYSIRKHFQWFCFSLASWLLVYFHFLDTIDKNRLHNYFPFELNFFRKIVIKLCRKKRKSLDFVQKKHTHTHFTRRKSE